MPDPTCFIEPFGVCISQVNAVSGAIVAAIASIATTGWKIVSDWKAVRHQNVFASGERAAREEFEKREREARQSFESEERKAREDGAKIMALEAAHAQERIQKELQSYIKLEKWREESWKRVLERLERAHRELEQTTVGLMGLIDDGPILTNLRMIKETAKVLDVFGDFQTSVRHFSLPETIETAASEFVELATRILLTLSPLQEVRQSEERKTLLHPLKAELIQLSSTFMRLCREFERNPSTFLPSERAA